MVSEPKLKVSKKTKRRRMPPEEIVDYIVLIEDWDWGYSLSLNTERDAIDPYREFRHLQIRGRLLHPKCRCRQIRILTTWMRRPTKSRPKKAMNSQASASGLEGAYERLHPKIGVGSAIRDGMSCAQFRRAQSWLCLTASRTS